MLSLLSCLLALWLVVCLANPINAKPHRLHQRQSVDQPCADIFDQGYEIVPAKLAYDCLTSAPFNATTARDFLQYYNDTLQFQSTLAYLKNPPPSYQQPAVDVLASLDAILRRVQSAGYPNQYAFEAAVQELVYATHDAHVFLSAGILSAFTFGSPLRIVSVSTDGIALPKIYIPDDLLEAEDQNVDWIPSPVANINGEDVTKFLTQFAAINAQGNIEPDADWNQLMSSPAADVQGIQSAFDGLAIFYPGENITFEFENGTIQALPWLAFLSDSSYYAQPAISSGQDLYDFFVLGVETSTTTDSDTSNSTTSDIINSTATATPSDTNTASSTAASSVEDFSSATASADATPSSWEYSPYPSNPVVAQPDLGYLSGGVVSGYFLNDGVTAVLSIPSFAVTSEAVLSFSTTIAEFIEQSKAAGLTRVIIDLQRNSGGSALLATDAFKQFFPSIDPHEASRLRAHPYADALGNSFTTYYNTQPMDSATYQVLSANVWVASAYLNAATGRNFTSWAEFFGPHFYNSDLFTTTQRNNFSSSIFSQSATDEDLEDPDGIVVYGFGNRSATSPQPYAAEQLVLLTDAYCSSACGTFVELMHHQAGVRTVVAGGRPEQGPMQAVGRSRGAQAYDTVALDEDMEFAESINASLSAILPNRSVTNYIKHAVFNIKDAIRKDEDLPRQFAYEAATCRIFYTKHTVYNYLNLWNYVVDAIWRNPSLCIFGSANGTPGDSSESTGPATNKKQITADNDRNFGSLVTTGLDNPPQKRDLNAPIQNLDRASAVKRATPSAASQDLSTFLTNGLINVPDCKACDARNGYICASVPTCVQGKSQIQKTCQRSCSPQANRCSSTEHCFLQSTPNFCISNKAAKQLAACSGTPTRTRRTQQTKAVGGGNFQLPYGRTSLKNVRSG